MSMLRDSSEIQEASKLIADLLKPKATAADPGESRSAAVREPSTEPKPAAPASPAAASNADIVRKPEAKAETAAVEAVSIAEQRSPEASVLPVPGIKDKSEAYFRGDKLENALEAMCKRSGFTGAVVADNKGLPLAVFNSPVGADAIAAFTTVLGGALEKAGTLLGQHGAETISMDINYADKVVLRLFMIEQTPYFMMILCPQNVDERGEIELSIKHIVGILTES